MQDLINWLDSTSTDPMFYLNVHHNDSTFPLLTKKLGKGYCKKNVNTVYKLMFCRQMLQKSGANIREQKYPSGERKKGQTAHFLNKKLPVFLLLISNNFCFPHHRSVFFFPSLGSAPLPHTTSVEGFLVHAGVTF